MGSDARGAGSRRRCGWLDFHNQQCAKLVPCARSALSGELQARAVQFKRASIAAVTDLKAVGSRLVRTTNETKTDRRQHASRTEGRLYVQALGPRPVPVPRTSPAATSPGAGGTKPRTPDPHARSA